MSSRLAVLRALAHTQSTLIYVICGFLLHWPHHR